MTHPSLSVIIPAYNKRGVLAETLAALECQDVPGGYEVIVVDDGSTDGTQEWLHSQAWRAGAGSALPYRFTALTQANGGPAVARNAGVAVATGELLLFLDADMVAAPGLLAAHCADHERHPHALILGRMMPWRQALGGPSYQVFGRMYDLGGTARVLPPRFGLTGNLSIAAADFAAIGGFDPSLKWGEDTEMVYRAVGAPGLTRTYREGRMWSSRTGRTSMA